MRVYASYGNAYEKNSRDDEFIWARRFIIGLDTTPTGMPERSVYIDPVHVTRIEPIDGGKGETTGHQQRR